MTQKTQISEEMFNIWIKDPVTLDIFERLKTIRASLTEYLQENELIFDDKGQLKLARLIGQREGIDTLLNIEWEDTNEN